MKSKTDSFLVGFNYREDEDHAVMVIAKKNWRGGTEIINSFFGDEAKELYAKLTTKKGEIS